MADPAPAVPPRRARFVRAIGWCVSSLLALWTTTALSLTWTVAGVLFVVAWLVAAAFGRGREATPWLLAGVTVAIALGWWLRPPRNDRAWEPEFAETPWAEIVGDTVTLHHVRHFDWRTETDFTPRWETRTYRLSQLQALDFFMTYWGSRHMCHTMVTFDFGAGGRLCASIEARREVGEPYSALGGMFRRHELIYVFADERDVVRLRTEVRPHNDVYLFRLRATPETARRMFLDYLRTAQALRTQPAWYHTLFTNCSTTIREHVRRADVPDPWDWRVLANGHADERLYDFHYITRELPLPELKRRSLINAAAHAAAERADFSAQIRAGRPGFGP